MNDPLSPPDSNPKAAAKRQAEQDKIRRRLHRELDARQKRHDMVALCGVNFYSSSPRDRDRGNHWTHCASCGKPLRYFGTYEEALATLRECRRE